MSDINLEDYIEKSTLIWAVQNIRLPKGAPWEFNDRQWQLKIMDDPSKEIVCRKPTQIGMSTVFITKMLHFADTHQCRAVVTLPRQDDVYDMVNSRLSEIISESPYILDKMTGVDNVRMKKFGKSWIHFIEMSVPPRMMDVDWMVNDEVDLSNSEHLQQVISRMDASKFGYHHRISTPTIDDYGIDKLYKLSDQKQWIVTCGYCSHEQMLDWDKNVAHKNGETWYKCARCGNKLHPQDIREGHWIATENTHSSISGYQINQLMCTYIDPNKLWTQYKTMSQKNFYNFRLGLPFTPTSGGFSKDVIHKNCFSEGYEKEETDDKHSVYVLGCDQGDILHVSVGKLVDNYIEIVYLDEVPFSLGFEEINRLITRYNVKYAIIDGLPNHHPAQKLVDTTRIKAAVAYFSGIDTIYRYKEDENKITINKTDAYDLLLDYVTSSRLQFYSSLERIDDDVDKAITHICNMRRDIEEQETRIGGTRTFHVWKNIGPDHFADAVVYMLIAADLANNSNTTFNAVDIDQIVKSMSAMQEDGTHVLSSGIDSYIDDLILGNAPKVKLEPNLRGTNAGERLEPNLAPMNPYQLRDSLIRFMTGE